METGSETLVAARLDNGLRDLGQKVMISTVVVIASVFSNATPARADLCSDMIDIVSAKQGGTLSKQRTTSQSGQSKVVKTEVQTLTRAITLEDLFTFEASADAMGFRPEKRTIRATSEQLEAVMKLTDRNSELIVEMAGEMHFYLEKLPLTSFDDLFDLVKLRDQMNAEPETVRDLYFELADIAYRAQSPRANPFPPNTDMGVAQGAVLSLTAMHLNPKTTLDIVETRSLMRNIENSFPNERRLHQLQFLQIFLAKQISEPAASFDSYVKLLRRLQSDLVIERKVMGFAGMERFSPSLEQALIFKILGDKIEFTEDNLIAVIQHIIRTQSPESFDEVARVVAQGVKNLQAKKAAASNAEKAVEAPTDP